MAAAMEVLLLLAVGANLTGSRSRCSALQLVCASAVLALSFRGPASPSGAPAPA